MAFANVSENVRIYVYMCKILLENRTLQRLNAGKRYMDFLCTYTSFQIGRFYYIIQAHREQRKPLAGQTCWKSTPLCMYTMTTVVNLAKRKLHTRWKYLLLLIR